MSQEIKALQEKIAISVAALEFPQQPADLYDPIRYTLELGGKRMRPALVLMGCSPGSYTNLTQPTNRDVEISVVAVSHKTQRKSSY